MCLYSSKLAANSTYFPCLSTSTSSGGVGHPTCGVIKQVGRPGHPQVAHAVGVAPLPPVCGSNKPTVQLWQEEQRRPQHAVQASPPLSVSVLQQEGHQWHPQVAHTGVQLPPVCGSDKPIVQQQVGAQGHPKLVPKVAPLPPYVAVALAAPQLHPSDVHEQLGQYAAYTDAVQPQASPGLVSRLPAVNAAYSDAVKPQATHGLVSRPQAAYAA